MWIYAVTLAQDSCASFVRDSVKETDLNKGFSHGGVQDTNGTTKKYEHGVNKRRL